MFFLHCDVNRTEPSPKLPVFINNKVDAMVLYKTLLTDNKIEGEDACEIVSILLEEYPYFIESFKGLLRFFHLIATTKMEVKLEKVSEFYRTFLDCYGTSAYRIFVAKRITEWLDKIPISQDSEYLNLVEDLLEDFKFFNYTEGDYEKKLKKMREKYLISMFWESAALGHVESCIKQGKRLLKANVSKETKASVLLVLILIYNTLNVEVAVKIYLKELKTLDPNYESLLPKALRESFKRIS